MMTAFVPLATLLAAGRPAEHVVAIHGGRHRSWAELASRVAGLARLLDGPPSTRWALSADDAWAFAVGLLGIWHAGGIAVIPPNRQPGTLKEVAADVRGIVTDRPDAMVGAEIVPALVDGPASPPSWRALEPEIPRLELSTSGTSGARRVVVKAVAHLDREVATHEAGWGGLVGRAHAVATVSPQHIYGLLFRIAWPLSSGRVFLGETPLHPAEVGAAVRAAGAAYLVSTPAHLRRLARAPLALPRLAGHCRVIFSSGGPLDPEAARALARGVGAAPVEVFGSTETGGVAWRRQGDAHDAAWTPFSEVRVGTTGPEPRLQVSSPWIAEPGRHFTMGDRAELTGDGRFLLGPRADRIVKIGEKRLALPEMEARLHEHPFVEAAALVLLDRQGDARLAGAVVPTGEGLAVLQRDGRRSLGTTLGRWLEPHWDRVLVPRVWRFVDRLPEDAQGKTSVAALQALFRSPVGR
jgi:acyl-coenzyme A synthetase/AMP-(fatty) acid ligase